MENGVIIQTDLESALKRLKWFVSKKGNVEDIEAFNTVLNYINLFQKKQVRLYPIVAKFFLKEFLLLSRSDREYTAVDAVNEIKKTIAMPLSKHYEILKKEVPIARFEALYEDLEEEVREARRIAEANKIPARESDTLSDEYRDEDVINVVKTKRKAMSQKMVKVLETEYTQKEAEYFVETQVKELLLLNND